MSEQISRRGFLRMFGGGATAAVVAPTYFFAPIGGWKSDVIVNPLTATVTSYGDWSPQDALFPYYNPAALENLRKQMPFPRMATHKSIPRRKDHPVNFYRFELGRS